MRPAIQPPLKRSAMVEGLDMRCSNVKLLWNGFSPHSYPLVMVELSGLWMTTPHLHQPGYKYHLICRYYDRYYVVHTVFWHKDGTTMKRNHKKLRNDPWWAKREKKRARERRSLRFPPSPSPRHRAKRCEVCLSSGRPRASSALR